MIRVRSHDVAPELGPESVAVASYLNLKLHEPRIGRGFVDRQNRNAVAAIGIG